MATKPPPAQTRKLVESVARELAEKNGMTLTDAALEQLLAPSKEYFREEGRVSIGRERLKRGLEPVVKRAIASAREEEKKPKKAPPRLRRRRRVAAKKPPQKRRTNIRKGDVREAMKRTKHRFLWF